MNVKAIPYRLYRSAYETFLIIRRNRWAFSGLIILLFFLLMATVGPYVVPLDMTPRTIKSFQLPSWKHPLGTDYAGRDVLALIVHGSRDVLSIALLAAIFTVNIAVVVGMFAGLHGGAVDSVLMFLANIVLTVPDLPVMMILAVIFKVRDPFSFAAILSFWAWGELARAVRSQVLSLKERQFIEAARALGLSSLHIVFRELLPNVMPFVAINFVTIMTEAITASVSLIFLGLAPFSVANWGMMLNLARWQTGAIYVPKAICYVLSPMVAIALLQLGGVFFSHGLDEILDPRLRGWR
jgi:peptide/nickel transport system permease protein